MKKMIFLISLILLGCINSFVFSQAGNPIVLSKSIIKVPKGKVWKMEKGKTLLVEFTSFDQYSMCGSAILSNPGVILIRSGDKEPYTTNQIYFNQLTKIPFTNNNTYSINPIKDVFFFAETPLMVGLCLKNIQLYEYDVVKKDFEQLKLTQKVEEKQEDEEIEKAKKQKDNDIKFFLKERATKVFPLEDVNDNGYDYLRFNIKRLVQEKYKEYNSVDSLYCKYRFVFSSDTLGLQTIDLIKESGNDLDSHLISRLKSLVVMNKKFYGYDVATFAEYPIEVKYIYMDVKFRKYQPILQFFNPKPPRCVQDLMARHFGLISNGTYKVKIYYRNVMDKLFSTVGKPRFATILF